MRKRPITFSNETGDPRIDNAVSRGYEPTIYRDMSPDEYLCKVGQAHTWEEAKSAGDRGDRATFFDLTKKSNCPLTAYNHLVNSWDLENSPQTKRVRTSVSKTRRLDYIPSLNVDNYADQEGRHRMMALKQLGVEKVPVAVFSRRILR